MSTHTWDWRRPFGDELRDHMEARGLTHRLVAARAGIDHSTVSRCLDGREPSLRVAIAIIDALGCLPEKDGGTAAFEEEADQLREAVRLARLNALRGLRPRYEVLADTLARLDPPDAPVLDPLPVRLRRYQRTFRALIELHDAFEAATPGPHQVVSA